MNKLTRLKRILPYLSKFSLKNKFKIILNILLDNTKLIN